MDFEDYYRIFYNELNIAMSSFSLWRKLRELTSDEAVLSALNKTPESWITIIHSLRVSLFVTLHRIYETDKGCISAEALLLFCKNNIEIFGSNELRKRKDPSGSGSSSLDEYMRDCFFPKAEDFDVLRGKLRKNRNIFNENYRPIRSKIIAHKIARYVGNESKLYSKTDVVEVESLIKFLYGLRCVLFNLYHNGKRPDIESYDVRLDDYEDIDFVIRRISGQ